MSWRILGRIPCMIVMKNPAEIPEGSLQEPRMEPLVPAWSIVAVESI